MQKDEEEIYFYARGYKEIQYFISNVKLLHGEKNIYTGEARVSVKLNSQEDSWNMIKHIKNKRVITLMKFPR